MFDMFKKKEDKMTGLNQFIETLLPFNESININDLSYKNGLIRFIELEMLDEILCNNGFICLNITYDITTIKFKNDGDRLFSSRYISNYPSNDEITAEMPQIYFEKVYVHKETKFQCVLQILIYSYENIISPNTFLIFNNSEILNDLIFVWKDTENTIKRIYQDDRHLKRLHIGLYNPRQILFNYKKSWGSSSTTYNSLLGIFLDLDIYNKNNYNKIRKSFPILMANMPETYEELYPAPPPPPPAFKLNQKYYFKLKSSINTDFNENNVLTVIDETKETILIIYEHNKEIASLQKDKYDLKEVEEVLIEKKK